MFNDLGFPPSLVRAANVLALIATVVILAAWGS